MLHGHGRILMLPVRLRWQDGTRCRKAVHVRVLVLLLLLLLLLPLLLQQLLLPLYIMEVVVLYGALWLLVLWALPCPQSTGAAGVAAAAICAADAATVVAPAAWHCRRRLWCPSVCLGGVYRLLGGAGAGKRRGGRQTGDRGRARGRHGGG